jgi:5-aminopentanamidase
MKIPIACGQFVAKRGDAGANAASMAVLAREAAALGAALIVFPEMCLSGYLGAEEARRHAIAPEAEGFRTVAEAARAHKIALCFGFAEKAPDGRLFNSMAYVDAGGKTISTYRKVHLFPGEEMWAQPGAGFESFDAAGSRGGVGRIRCGMWICYDTRFPEAARTLAADGATCALAGAAWLGPADEWELAVRARAMDNGIYVAASALQGRDDRFAFNGASLIADPHGRILAAAEEGRAQVIVAEYDSEAVSAFRRRLPLLEHRRPAAYGT